MAESKMYMTSPPKMKEVLDVDVTMSPGIVFQFTVDYSAGDSIQEEDDKIVIVRHPKSLIKGFTAESGTAESEDVVIYRTHILMLQKRKRQVRELTAEEQDDLNRSVRAEQVIKTVSGDTQLH
jgi:hypothetical protein